MRNVSEKGSTENKKKNTIVPFMRKCEKMLYSGAGHR